MPFERPIFEGLFVKRYKRFFADIISPDGDTLTAHCPNTGSMKGCLIENAPCRYTFIDDPKRKLKYTLQAIKSPISWIGVNTHLTNQLVWEAWENNLIDHWSGYNFAKREVKINDGTRIDMVLWKNKNANNPSDDHLGELKKWDPKLMNKHKFHFVEVKNVTLVSDDDKSLATFPDSVTTRGQKHLRELMNLVKQGHTAEIFYLMQREDCTAFSAADDIDPVYGKLLREAKDCGVKVSAYPCKFSKTNIKLNPNQLELKL